MSEVKILSQAEIRRRAYGLKATIAALAACLMRRRTRGLGTDITDASDSPPILRRRSEIGQHADSHLPRLRQGFCSVMAVWSLILLYGSIGGGMRRVIKSLYWLMSFDSCCCCSSLRGVFHAESLSSLGTRVCRDVSWKGQAWCLDLQH